MTGRERRRGEAETLAGRREPARAEAGRRAFRTTWEFRSSEAGT